MKQKKQDTSSEHQSILMDRLALNATPFCVAFSNEKFQPVNQPFYSAGVKPFNLDPFVASNWKSKKSRLLIVLESVDSIDLKANRLMTYSMDERDRNPMTLIIPALLQMAFSEARSWDKSQEKQRIPYEDANEFPFALGVFNWNAAKSWTLSAQQRVSLENVFQDRLYAFIKKVKPTHILICGDTLARRMLRDQDWMPSKRGWVYDYKYSDDNAAKVVSTFDLQRLYASVDDDDSKSDTSLADLFYFVQRNVVNLILGECPYSLSHIKPHPVLVDTIEKFDKVLRKAESATAPIALDTETRNLSSTGNELYTVQLAFDESRGYVIPVDHPKTPFTKEERKHIKRSLRSFFSSTAPKTIITFNGQFDWRILRSQLKIQHVYHIAYEIQAGENLLDENVALLADFGAADNSIYNLQNCFTHYGNDWYRHAPFSKGERDSIALRPLDEEVLSYCALDCQGIYGIFSKQLERAYNTTVQLEDGKVYRYSKYFKTHMLKQMSDSTHALSSMEQNGSPVDIDYMKELAKPNSHLDALKKQLLSELKKFPEVQQANKKFGATTGLFGQAGWEFSFTRPEHKRVLFFDIMDLEPINKTSSGEHSAVDKHFVEAYENEYPIVDLYGQLQKAAKLHSTYVIGWLNKILESIDGSKDNAMRAAYTYIRVVTGRLASARPNLQQIPSRGKLASLIKRMFIAPAGTLGVRADYSAHEVRFWGNSARDSALSESFLAGAELRQRLIVTPKAERAFLFNELKTKGDLHLRNIFLVFGQWVDKSHPWRDQIKSTIFGLIYGMSRQSQAKDTRKKSIAAVRNDLSKIERTLAEPGADTGALNAALAVKNKELIALIEKEPEDWLREAQDLEKKIYSAFPEAGAWLETQKTRILTNFHVTSSLGRRRMLYRVLVGTKANMTSAQRRACNSPIQGESSEIAIRAAYLTLKHCYEFMKRHNLDLKDMPKYTRAVHDANYFIVPYSMMIPFLWIFQWSKTRGVAQLLEDDYGWKLPVDPDIEIEISASEDTGEDWNWTLENLRSCLKKALDVQAIQGRLEDKDSALETILASVYNKEIRNELQNDYALLGQKLPKDIWLELLRD